MVYIVNRFVSSVEVVPSSQIAAGCDDLLLFPESNEMGRRKFYLYIGVASTGRHGGIVATMQPCFFAAVAEFGFSLPYSI